MLQSVVSTYSYCKHASGILSQRLLEANLSLDCVDGILLLLIGSGTLPGDSIAGIWFLCAYHMAIDGFQTEANSAISFNVPWLHRCICDDSSQKLLMWGLKDNNVDVSISAYADDVYKTRRVEHTRFSESATRQDLLFEHHLSGVGVASNKSKKKTLVRFFGPGAHTAQRAAFDSGPPVSYCLKY